MEGKDVSLIFSIISISFNTANILSLKSICKEENAAIEGDDSSIGGDIQSITRLLRAKTNNY